MHAIIACQMEFQLYPMDIQICPIYIESFSYHNQKIRLKWADNGVTINPELKLLQYNLGQPLQLEETDGYMPEKYGKGWFNHLSKNMLRQLFRDFRKFFPRILSH